MADRNDNRVPRDVVHLLGDVKQDSNTGAMTDSQGNEVTPGPDRATIEDTLRRLTPRAPGMVGNLADLQRLGAQAVAEGKTNIDEAFVDPTDGAGPAAQAAQADAVEQVTSALDDGSGSKDTGKKK